MKNYLKMGIVLMIFAVIVAAALSAVYSITKDPIDKAELNFKLSAIKTVLTDYKTGKLLISESDVPDSLEKLDEKIWKQTDEENLFYSSQYKAYVASPVYRFTLEDGRDAYLVTGGGIAYGGYVKILASFIKNESGLEMFEIEVLDYSQETPGLGAKIAEAKPKERFFNIPEQGLEKGLKVDKDAGVSVKNTKDFIENEKKDGVIVTSDIMTGATITPRGVANALNAMYEYLKNEIGGEE